MCAGSSCDEKGDVRTQHTPASYNDITNIFACIAPLFFTFLILKYTNKNIQIEDIC